MVVSDLKGVAVRASEVSLVERLFLEADHILKKPTLVAEGEDLSKIRQRFEEYQEESLYKEIMMILKNPLADYEDDDLGLGDIWKLLAIKKNLLIIAGPGRDRDQLWQSFALYHALKNREITCVIYPLRSMINQRYESLKDCFKSFGLYVYKATGSISSKEEVRLMKGITDGKVDLLLTTPEYLKTNLDKLKTLKDRLRLCVLEEGDQTFNKLDSLKTEWEDPRILATTSLTDKEIVDRMMSTLNLDEVLVDSKNLSNLIFNDRREICDKDDYLIKLLEKKEKTLICVNSLSVSVELARKLRERLKLGEEIVYLHERVNINEFMMIEELFQKGKIKFIVTTDAIVEKFQIFDIRHIIHYQLPFHLTGFIQRCLKGGLDGEPTQVHLLYGDDDRKWNQRFLDSITPKQETLREIYKLLVKKADQNGQISQNNLRLIEELFKDETEIIPAVTLSAALRIFQELKLVDGVTLLPKPKQKLDLYSSIMYNEGIIEKKAFNDFWQIALNEDAEKLLERIK